MKPTKNGLIVKDQRRNVFDFIEEEFNDDSSALENLVIKILH